VEDENITPEVGDRGGSEIQWRDSESHVALWEQVIAQVAEEDSCPRVPRDKQLHIQFDGTGIAFAAAVGGHASTRAG
jgi:hypothetical protein